MHALSPQDILAAWETGLRRHPLERGLVLLAAAEPELSAGLSTLCIGQRDARLLLLREATFGPTLNSFAECPGCGERLELTMQVGDVLVSEVVPDPEGSSYTLTSGEMTIHFRLPNTLDLIAASECNDPASARQMIVQRCIIEPRNLAPLTDEAITLIATQMAKFDPQAEVLLDLACPACGQQWQQVFEITEFFWTEVSVQARRIIREVHLLASTYGWHERDILAMDAIRRQAY